MSNLSDMTSTLTPADLTSDPPAPSSGEKASVILVSVMDAWGILSSLFVLILIWSRKELRHSYFYWLVSNAVFACFLACTLVTPATIHQELAGRDLQYAYCVIYSVLLRVVHFMIPVSLTMVIIDRIIYIYDPIIYVRKVTGPVVNALIWLPWILSLVFGLCSFLPYRGMVAQRYLMDDPDHHHCVIRFGFEYFHVQEKFVVSLYYAVPVFLLVAAMLVLMLALCHRKHCCISHMDEFDFETDDMRENACRAVAPVSFVVLAYILLLLPFLVVSFQEVEQTGWVGEEGRRAAIWVFISFEWVEAVIWVLLLPDLRSAVCSIVCCCCYYEEEDDVDDLRLVRAEKRYT